jgi:hypothetical protein
VIVDGTLFKDNVTSNCARAFWNRGATNTALLGNTVLGETFAGVFMDRSTDNVGLPTDAVITNTLVVGSGTGFLLNNGATWQVDHGDAMAPTAYSPNTNVTASLTTDPALGGCIVYIPATSAVKGAGAGGADIGANVIFRYQDRALTATKLWDQTGSFSCGAQVPGVDDDPTGTTIATEACGNAHLRLGFDGTCPVP